MTVVETSPKLGEGEYTGDLLDAHNVERNGTIIARESITSLQSHLDNVLP